MWLIRYVFCAFLIKHFVLISVTCEVDYGFRETTHGERTNLPAKHVTRHGERTDLPARHATKHGERTDLPTRHVTERGERTDLPARFAVRRGKRTDLPARHATGHGERTDLPAKHATRHGERTDLPARHVTEHGERTDLPARHVTKPGERTKLPTKKPKPGRRREKEHPANKSITQWKANNQEHPASTQFDDEKYSHNPQFRSDFSLDAVHNIMSSAAEGLKRLFTARYRNCSKNKPKSSESFGLDYEYSFRDSEGKNHPNKEKPPQKENKRSNSSNVSQHKNRFTPRSLTIQHDLDDVKFSIKHEMEPKPEIKATKIYYISEDDFMNFPFSIDDLKFEISFYTFLNAEPKYFPEVVNLIKGLLKGYDISHMEDFNILSNLSHKTTDAFNRIQKLVPQVNQKSKEIINSELEMGKFRRIELQNQLLEKEIPIGNVKQFVEFNFFVKEKPPKKTIIIVVPPIKPKNIKVDQFTDVEYNLQRGSLLLLPTYRAKIRTGSLEFGNVVVTFYPSRKQFIVQDRKLFTCDGYFSEKVLECEGVLKPFLPAKLEDNCYLNNFPKALGHACVSKRGHDVYMFYREGRLVCHSDAEDVQHMTFEAVNKLCSKVASSATYIFRDINGPYGSCEEKVGLCQLQQSLVLTEDSDVPLNV